MLLKSNTKSRAHGVWGTHRHGYHAGPAFGYHARALSTLNFGISCGKGVRSQKPVRPCGCFALLTPDPVSARATYPREKTMTKPRLPIVILILSLAALAGRASHAAEGHPAPVA